MSSLALLVAIAFSAAVTERPDAVRSCHARVEGGGGVTIRPQRDIRIGPVVFFGLRHPERQAVLGTHGRDAGFKIPIAVRAGRPVRLRIPPEVRGDLAFNYGARNAAVIADGQSLVLVRPCPPRTRRFTNGRPIGRWTAFSGGFIVRTPGCYPIEVARRGKPFTRRLVALGERC
jgi:hypothetical protein